MTCSRCNRTADEIMAANGRGAVFVTGSAQVGKRQVVWHTCAPCVVEERRAGDGAAQSAITQAESAGA
jgi:hypothetical protein